jgi:hypothetical protein
LIISGEALSVNTIRMVWLITTKQCNAKDD